MRQGSLAGGGVADQLRLPFAVDEHGGLPGGGDDAVQEQPRVPEVIPKVWLPKVPLVVTARTCRATPFGLRKPWDEGHRSPLLAAAKAVTGRNTTSGNSSFFMVFTLGLCFV